MLYDLQYIHNVLKVCPIYLLSLQCSLSNEKNYILLKFLHDILLLIFHDVVLSFLYIFLVQYMDMLCKMGHISSFNCLHGLFIGNGIFALMTRLLIIFCLLSAVRGGSGKTDLKYLLWEVIDLQFLAMRLGITKICG